MPESRSRKTDSHKSSSGGNPEVKKYKPSPRWWAPTMVALLLIGLLLVVITYLSGSYLPFPFLGKYNVGVGFLTMIAGMIMSMGWR